MQTVNSIENKCYFSLVKLEDRKYFKLLMLITVTKLIRISLFRIIILHRVLTVAIEIKVRVKLRVRVRRDRKENRIKVNNYEYKIWI